MNLHLALLLAYSAGLVALGVWIGRSVRGARDFFVAGRGLGPGLIFSTMLAANIGAGSTVGATGLGYRDGLSAWWWVGSAGVGSLILAFWIGPAMRRLAAAHDLRTVGDYLELRYGPSVRGIIALLLWAGSLAILAGQLIAIASILNVVAGTPKGLACAIGGVLITVYSSAGGLKSGAWVNMVQLAVKVTGFAVALPLALTAVGGWPAVKGMAVPAADYWSFWSGGQSGVVYLAMLGPAFVVSPGLLQKLFGARDDHAVRLGIGANAAGLLTYAIVPVLLGMTARVKFQHLASPDLALPMILMHALPAAIGALGLAAVFSAELSSADAVLFMLTTSLSQDLYKRFIAPASDERRILLVARLTTIAAGAIGTSLAIVSPTVIGMLSIFYTLLGVSLFVPLLGGLYVPCAGTAEALAAIATGVGGMLFAHVTTAGKGYGHLTPALIGFAVAVSGFVIVLAARRGVRLGSDEGRTGVRPQSDPIHIHPTGRRSVAHDMFTLNRKVIAVVGAGSGIGEAIALGAADQGAAFVACLDINEAGAAAVAARITAQGGKAGAGAIDITDADATRACFDLLAATHGTLDGLVCTPSINVRKPILAYSGEEFDRVVRVNLRGNFNVLQAAGRIMTKRKRGSIVLYSSIRSIVTEPGQSVYSMTKAGILQLAKTAATEWAMLGVRVNAVGPGVVETPLTAPIKNNKEWYDAYAMKSPMQRWAQPGEMVGPTLFLLSDAASYVTGTIIYADGGWLAADGRFIPPGM